MLQIAFTPERIRRAEATLSSVDEYGYGLSPAWLGRKWLGTVRDELSVSEMCNVALDYHEALLLPPFTRAILVGLGEIALDNGLCPKQLLAIHQEPLETGTPHFDNGVKKSLAISLSKSQISITRPRIDGLPDIDPVTGEFNLERAHHIVTPEGTLFSFAGTKMNGYEALHRVDNPSSDNPRYSLVMGCQ